MFLSVRELELRKAHFDVAVPPGVIDYIEKLKQVSDLHAKGTAELLAGSDELRVIGSLEVTMQAACDRCLETVDKELKGDFDLFYTPEPEIDDRRPNEEVALVEGETQIGFYTGEGLELNDILREHILLSLPMQYVCNEACKGICPVCGQSRNQADCGCREELVDERWAALKNLK